MKQRGGDPGAESGEPWQDLALAILRRAYRDAMSRNGHAQEARAWMHDGSAARALGLLEVSPSMAGRVVGSVPEPDYEQLVLFGE